MKGKKEEGDKPDRESAQQSRPMALSPSIATFGPHHEPFFGWAGGALTRRGPDGAGEPPMGISGGGALTRRRSEEEEEGCAANSLTVAARSGAGRRKILALASLCCSLVGSFLGGARWAGNASAGGGIGGGAISLTSGG